MSISEAVTFAAFHRQIFKYFVLRMRPEDFSEEDL